jgi:tetratricopeptide (TPR) repeat protein
MFVLPDQPPSRRALRQLQSIAAREDALAGVQLLVIVSGAGADAAATRVRDDAGLTCPVIADEPYAASGRMSVHVWPTTVIVHADGRQIAHIPGVPTSLARDVQNYIALATGQIDQAELERRLNTVGNVVDTAPQMAARHLEVARRLLDKNLPEQALLEVQKAADLKPASPLVNLSIVDMLLSLDQSATALRMLDEIDTDAVRGVPAHQVKLIRAKALIAASRWDDARRLLSEAVRLNPDPAAAYYQLGQVEQHQGNWQAAAEAYRKAYESTRQSRQSGVAATSEPSQNRVTSPRP